MYSKFGDSYPTMDVSLDKLDQGMEHVFDNLFQELADFIVEKFLIKLDIDGDEMRHSNGSAYFDKSQNYMRFLSLKGYYIYFLQYYAISSMYSFLFRHFKFRTPFVIKYDASLGKTSKLRTHKDNSDVSFILLISNPSDFEGGGTYFHAIDKAIYLEQGEALIFNGQLVHEAIPITTGKRFVISGFITFTDEYIKMKVESLQYNT